MMVLHPEVQKKAQAEIDKVIGTDHLPTLEDRPDLPYIECVVKEVFRYARQAYTRRTSANTVFLQNKPVAASR